MEIRENVEGQMRMDIMDREESRVGEVSVPMAGPCWARRRTAGPASAAKVGLGRHLPKPETG